MDESHDSFDMLILRKLTLKKCNASLTEDELRELSGILASSEHAREEYWQLLMVHAQLQWDLGGKTADFERIAEQGLKAADLAMKSPHRFPPSRSSWTYLAIAACLAVAVFCGSWVWQRFENQPLEGMAAHGEGQPESVAILGKIRALAPDSRWSLGRRGRLNENVFRAGDTISLDAGELEIHLHNGTVAVLKAPVVMQAVSLDRVWLLQGSIKVDVAQGAEGFAVETISADVIDLGTVFSVGVESNGTNVIVFDGEVDLRYGEHSGEAGTTERGRSKRFQAGEAVHVSQDGTLSRIINVNQSDFSTSDSRSSTAPLIKAVRDNIARDDMFSFYEIVPGGMDEDQRSYVDRPHEWNGATPDGMPGYLVGGDYVKTFCNDKITEDLLIEVTISRPAILFILFDKRAIPPDWLTQSFESTGDDIGIDETGFDVWKQEPSARNHLEVGPGNSIERRFSIWRKVVTEAGIVSLGPNGAPIRATKSLDLNAKMAMYGIVAVPLEQVD